LSKFVLDNYCFVFSVDGKTVSSIKNGLCVLVGIDRKDAPKEAEWL
jgi:D-Tyr-tRNAtyr deacylase